MSKESRLEDKYTMTTEKGIFVDYARRNMPNREVLDGMGPSSLVRVTTLQKDVSSTSGSKQIRDVFLPTDKTLLVEAGGAIQVFDTTELSDLEAFKLLVKVENVAGVYFDRATDELQTVFNSNLTVKDAVLDVKNSTVSSELITMGPNGRQEVRVDVFFVQNPDELQSALESSGFK